MRNILLSFSFGVLCMGTTWHFMDRVKDHKVASDIKEVIEQTRSSSFIVGMITYERACILSDVDIRSTHYKADSIATAEGYPVMY